MRGQRASGDRDMCGALSRQKRRDRFPPDMAGLGSAPLRVGGGLDLGGRRQAVRI